MPAAFSRPVAVRRACRETAWIVLGPVVTAVPGLVPQLSVGSAQGRDKVAQAEQVPPAGPILGPARPACQPLAGPVPVLANSGEQPHHMGGATPDADPWEGRMTRPNPRTRVQAMAWARAQVDHPSRWWADRCLNFVAQAYGWRDSGIRRAVEHYLIQPSNMRFRGDHDAPAGALMFWATGHRSGHVALSLGGGLIASTDIRRRGRIDVVESTAPEQIWGARYLGWTVPNFPHGEAPGKP
jgi:hypothetical protein